MKTPVLGEMWRAVVVGLVGLLAWAGPSIVAASDEVRLDDLAWMAGTWRGSADDVSMEEFWTGPLGGIMLGLHRDVYPDRSAFFEYLRIEQRDPGVVYVASPRGRDATEFVLVSAGPTEVVFENPEHDFPQRIIYRREGTLMVSRIEGVLSGEATFRQWEWRLDD